MAQRIETLKTNGQELELFVSKNWNENNPDAVSFIKNRTHYFLPKENMEIEVKVSPQAYSINTGEDLSSENLADDAAEAADSIGTANLIYNWSKNIELPEDLKKEAENANLAIEIVDLAQTSNQAVIRLLPGRGYTTSISNICTVDWDGKGTFKIGLIGTEQTYDTLRVTYGTVEALNPAYLPIDNETLTLNPQGKLAFTWEPSDHMIDQITSTINDVLNKDIEELHDWNWSNEQKDPTDSKGQRYYVECNVCGEKKFYNK